jgi:hypothetical protein
VRPAIGLADLVRAMTALQAQGDDPTEIARVLGFTPSAPPPPLPPSRPTDDGTQPRVTGTHAGQLADTTAAATGTVGGNMSVNVAAHDRVRAHGPVALRNLGRVETAAPAWLPRPGTGEDLFAPDPARPPPPPPPIETLFEPRRHRALLSAALATFDDNGPLDLERLLDALATRRMPQVLPRRPEASMRRGVWLLLDRTAAMVPFFEDIADLSARIARVAGRDLTRVQSFSETPEQVWNADLLEETPVELPPPGTPLVAITDLCMRAGASASWRPLLLRLRARGCRAVAIVPHRTEHCPAELRGLITVVPWDRATQVRTVVIRRRRAR